MGSNNIILKKNNGIAIINLNRPDKYNVINDGMREELKDAIDDINGSEDVKIIVFTGSGKAFCAGGDIQVMKDNFEKNYSNRNREEIYRNDVAGMVKYFKSIKKLTIAAINGHAFGAGCSIALLCDIRLAADTAKFGLPFGRRGLIPDWGATYFLPRIVGLPKAIELCVMGETFDARKALEIGLVNRVFSSDRFMDSVISYCSEILKSGPLSIKLCKEAMSAAVGMELDTALELEGKKQAVCYCSDEHKEGVMSFFEKRDANFSTLRK